MKELAIIIVNWNGYTDTIACLDSIRALDTHGMKVLTIVVDNGSTDGSAKRISHAHPWAMLITTHENTGFTGGNNIGMKFAYLHGSDYIWLVNNDTVLDTNAAVLADAVRGRGGIAGSKIYFAPGREYHSKRYADSERGKVIWYAGGIVDWDNMYASHRGVDEVDRGQFDGECDTQYVSGCSMMISRDVIRSIGYLDTRYYLYLEDLDYCLRAQRRGFALRYYPQSVLWHVNAGSSGGAGSPVHEYYQTRNRLLIGMKFAPVRTKLALVREAFGFYMGDNAIRKRAVSDACLWRWGRRND